MSVLRCCTCCGAVYRKDFGRCANDGLELTTAVEDPLIGAEVGSYVVSTLLGEGAMGRVYRAYHRHLVHKVYALKVLLGDLAMTQSMRLRFAKEAESASRLAHPNVVGVLDFGRTEKGLMYLAMDLVDGPSLGDILLGNPMAPARVVRLVRQMAEGLAHAHGIGLIHRDFKPDNVLVVGSGDDEVARIADFGLAISADHEDARLTETGFVMGTAGYIAPEQCTGKPIDHRADLYALGATMYEMLTGGTLPFAGPAPEVIGAKTTRAAPPIAERAPGIAVPPGVAAIVAKLLERRPENRFQTAAAVIEALDAIGATDADVVHAAPSARIDDTVVGVPSEAMRKPGHPVWRRAALVAGAAAGCFLVAFAVWLAMRPGATKPVAASVTLPPVTAPPVSEASGASGASEPADTSEPDTLQLAHADQHAGVHAAAAPRVDRRRSRDEHKSSGASHPSATHPDAVIASPYDGPSDSTSGRTVGRTSPDKPDKPDKSDRPDKPDTGRTVSDRTSGTAASGTPDKRDKPDKPDKPDNDKPDAGHVEAPKPRAAHIAGFDVDGSLPVGVVRRALDRVAPALRTCSSTKPETVEVRFSIGEARRATGTRAGGSSPSADCIVAAISAIRTDAAPDVGDVAVRVRVEFSAN